MNVTPVTTGLSEVVVVSETEASVLGCIIGSLGLKVEKLGSSAELGPYLQDHTPRLLVLDAALSGVNGTSVADRVKKIARLKDTPVIVLCEAEGRLRAQAEFCKADRVILKPFAASALKDAVAELLSFQNDLSVAA